MTEPVSEAPPRLHVVLGCVGNVPFHTSVPLTSLSAVGIFDGNSRGALEPSGGTEERNPRMIPARANRVCPVLYIMYCTSHDGYPPSSPPAAVFLLSSCAAPQADRAGFPSAIKPSGSWDRRIAGICFWNLSHPIQYRPAHQQRTRQVYGPIRPRERNPRPLHPIHPHDTLCFLISSLFFIPCSQSYYPPERLTRATI